MTRNLRGSLLIAAMLIATWATSSEACHRRRACAPNPCGYGYASPTGYYTAGGGYYGGYAGGMTGYPGTYGGYGYGGYGYGGYDFGRPGYNPGGLGGPWSGLGVRPGLGVGGFGLRR